MTVYGQFAATIDLRPAASKGEIWRQGRKLEPREALEVVEELRELLIDQLEAKPPTIKMAAARIELPAHPNGCRAPSGDCQDKRLCTRHNACTFETWAAYPSRPGAA